MGKKSRFFNVISGELAIFDLIEAPIGSRMLLRRLSSLFKAKCLDSESPGVCHQKAVKALKKGSQKWKHLQVTILCSGVPAAGFIRKRRRF